MTEIPEQLSLPQDGTRVRAMTLPSIEYDTESEEVVGILTKVPTPLSSIPNCWVGSREVDPATIEVMEEENAVSP